MDDQRMAHQARPLGRVEGVMLAVALGRNLVEDLGGRLVDGVAVRLPQRRDAPLGGAHAAQPDGAVFLLVLAHETLEMIPSLAVGGVQAGGRRQPRQVDGEVDADLEAGDPAAAAGADQLAVQLRLHRGGRKSARPRDMGPQSIHLVVERAGRVTRDCVVGVVGASRRRRIRRSGKPADGGERGHHSKHAAHTGVARTDHQGFPSSLPAPIIQRR
jgi:hypothetical protein